MFSARPHPRGPCEFTAGCLRVALRLSRGRSGQNRPSGGVITLPRANEGAEPGLWEPRASPGQGGYVTLPASQSGRQSCTLYKLLNVVSSFLILSGNQVARGRHAVSDDVFP